MSTDQVSIRHEGNNLIFTIPNPQATKLLGLLDGQEWTLLRDILTMNVDWFESVSWMAIRNKLGRNHVRRLLASLERKRLVCLAWDNKGLVKVTFNQTHDEWRQDV